MRIDFLPQRFIRQCLRGEVPFEQMRVPISTRLALGELYDPHVMDEAAEAVEELQRGSRFPELVKILFEHIGTPATWSHMRDVVRNNLSGSQQQARAWLRGADRLEDAAGFDDVDRDNVIAILDNLVGPGRTRADVTRDDMAALYGKRRRETSHIPAPPSWISDTDVLRGTARVCAIVDEECVEIAGQAGSAALKGKLYQVPGIGRAVGTYMTRSGFGWGTLTEIRVIAVLLELNHAVNRLRLSMPMPDGGLGPDIMIYRSMQGLKRLFSVVQCKALKDFGTMVSPNAASSESLRQIFSDTRRMGAEVDLEGGGVRPPWHAPNADEGAEGSGALFDGGYSFAFDFWHFIRNGDNPFVTIGNQVRRLPWRADEVFPGDLTGFALITRAKELMREVMFHRADRLSDTVNILRKNPPADEAVAYTPEIGNELVHVINNEILRKHRDNKSVGRLDIDALTPDKLYELNMITSAQRDHLATLLPPTSGAYRIEAARMALQLSDAALETMPEFRVSMVLVEEGGSWISGLTGMLVNLLP